ncbi:hypothetical protein R1flu_022338 [Riccia fluitans]|uniref:Fe2OG dioxygenase domain-containing protein n=1 Tax=Riccia fluitans TaxID=41844 RepID=A0ABD1ZRX9_9MARC
MAPPTASDDIAPEDVIFDTKRVVPVSVIKLASEATGLPPQFVKSERERPTVAYDDYCREIPVISLKGVETESRRKGIVAEIGRACAEWGIFQIVDHGVPEELMKNLMDKNLAFFKLPQEDKLKYATKPEGYPEAFGYATGSHRADDDVLDWREFMLHSCLPKNVHETAYSFWPKKPEGYRDTLVEYSDKIDGLVTLLLGLISESLGLPTDYIKNAVGGEDTEQKILFNYYPHCPQPDLTLGHRSHTDFGTITLLQQIEVGGLQAYKKETDRWVTVEPISGAFVVNLADQLQILSNGKYRSVLHQAVVNSNQTRQSIVTFANPSSMSQMGPVPELLNEANPAKYPSYIFKDYLRLFRSNVLVVPDGSAG